MEVKIQCTLLHLKPGHGQKERKLQVNILTEIAVIVLDMFCRKSYDFCIFVDDGDDGGRGKGRGSTCKEAELKLVATKND